MLQLAPGYAPALLGLSFYGDVDAEEWRRLAEQAFESDPTYAPALASLGNDAASRGDLEAAAEWINRALVLDADDPWVLWTVSALLETLERPYVSVDEYIVSLDPVNTEGLAALSYAYWQAGRYEEALETSATVLRLSPDAHAGHWGAAWSLLQLGRLEEALAEAEKLSKESSRLGLLSIIYHRLRDQDRSDAMLQETIEKFPESYSTLAAIAAWRGLVLYHLGGCF